MSISSRITYNTNSLNDIDIINKNYTLKQNNENINKDISCQSQNDNYKMSILNITTPLSYDQIKIKYILQNLLIIFLIMKII